MTSSIAKKAIAAISLFAASGMSISAFGADSGDQGLNDVIGASDFYRVNCPLTTDHLNFRIIDNTPLVSTVQPQLINILIKKGNKKTGFVTVSGGPVTPGQQEELVLAGGNGKYKIFLNTVGTNLAITQKQTFTIAYRCLNSLNQDTKPSSIRVKSKKIKNGKVKLLSVKCSASSTTGDTAQLYLKISNTTIDTSKTVLNAQVVKGNVASNISDTNGDAFYSNVLNVPAGSGIYTILANNTAFDPNSDNSRDYAFQYSCLNAANVDTGTPALQLIQDQ